MRRTLPLLALATLFASAPLFAQQTDTTTQPTTTQPKEGSVNDRRQDQQDRIANGVKSGQLTAGETKNIEGREANVNREIKDDRQADGGKLTAQERQQVNKQQNNLSKSDLQRQAQCQHGTLRQQRSGTAPRKPAGPHRAGH